MTTMRSALLVPLLTALGGCASQSSAPVPYPAPSSLLDTVIVASDRGETRSLAELVEALADTDVVVVGEYHGHNGAHLFQAQLQQALHQQDMALTLTMEQFEQQNQPVLDAYLAGELGEKELQQDANAWPNYEASYRPLVEYARLHGLPVVAANASADLVRCVGREGAGWLEGLAADSHSRIPSKPFFGSDAYRDKFYGVMGADADQAEDNSAVARRYQAQLLRDNTMAEQIARAHRQHPERRILHLTGTFHSEQGLGTVESLRHRAPDLTVTVLTPVFISADESIEQAVEENRQRGDFLYLLRPLPPQYRDPERQQQAFSHPSSSDRCDQPG